MTKTATPTKSRAGWSMSHQSLLDYLKPGDAVDPDLVDYARIPYPGPASDLHDLVQMGQSCGVVDGRAIFPTFAKVSGTWIYQGACWRGYITPPTAAEGAPPA